MSHSLFAQNLHEKIHWLVVCDFIVQCHLEKNTAKTDIHGYSTLDFSRNIILEQSS